MPRHTAHQHFEETPVGVGVGVDRDVHGVIPLNEEEYQQYLLSSIGQSQWILSEVGAGVRLLPICYI
jgi:hypothetical protein